MTKLTELTIKGNFTSLDFSVAAKAAVAETIAAAVEVTNFADADVTIVVVVIFAVVGVVLTTAVVAFSDNAFHVVVSADSS